MRTDNDGLATQLAAARKNRQNIFGGDAAARTIRCAQRKLLEPRAVFANRFQAKAFEMLDDIRRRLTGALAAWSTAPEFVGGQVGCVLFELFGFEWRREGLERSCRRFSCSQCARSGKQAGEQKNDSSREL